MTQSSLNVQDKRGSFLGKACLATLLLIPGCVSKVTHTSDYAGNMTPIPSMDSQEDGDAYAGSSRQLTEVKWEVIEKKGPKMAGEQFGLGSHPEAPRKVRHNQVQDSGPIIEGYVQVPLDPTTRPATRPANRFVSIPILSEEGLPVQEVPLMDGKIRLIWTLRNYGGTNVTSTRDPMTSRRTVAITPPDLTPLVTVLQSQLGAGGSVTPLPRENTIVVTCDRAMKSSVLDLLSKLDVAPKQVEISARIFEVSRDFDFQQGARVLLNHIGKDNSQTALSIFDPKQVQDAVTGAATSPVQGSFVSLVKVFKDAGISMDTSFQILADEGLIRMVSAPRMTVAAGQTGYMLAGQELPIQTANFVNAVLQASTTYKPVGVQLYITPQAVGPNRIKLHTISIVSSVSGFTPVPTLTGDNDGKFLMNPVIDSREAETAVTVENGSTLVISGLRMSRIQTREEKVPGLGDIPVLGWMFKNHHSQQQLTDLYFFVTPTLLDSGPVPHAHVRDQQG